MTASSGVSLVVETASAYALELCPSDWLTTSRHTRYRCNVQPSPQFKSRGNWHFASDGRQSRSGTSAEKPRRECVHHGDRPGTTAIQQTPAAAYTPTGTALAAAAEPGPVTRLPRRDGQRASQSDHRLTAAGDHLLNGCASAESRFDVDHPPGQAHGTAGKGCL